MDASMISVPIMKNVTVDKVLDIVKKNKIIALYLPDEEELTQKRISRDYLFTIVHSLEPTFFPRIIMAEEK